MMNVNLFAIFLFLVTVNQEYVEATNQSQAVPMLFLNKDEITIPVLVNDLRTNKNHTENYVADLNAFTQYNYTINQVKSGLIERDLNGSETFIIEGKRYPMGAEISELMTFNENGKPMFTLDLNNFKNIKLKDVVDDPDFVPDTPLKLKWRKESRCKFRNVDIITTTFSVQVYANDVLVSNLTLKKSNYTFRHYLNEGLLLIVMNPRTCRKTYESLMLTADFGGFRDLNWILDIISPGRLVIIISLRDGSNFLPAGTRNLLQKHGSFWTNFYLYLDTWINIFVNGGKTYQEVLIPFLGSQYSAVSPSINHLTFDFRKLHYSKHKSECINWPHTDRWRARKIFCQNFDGFYDLCRCKNPFDIYTRDQFQKENEHTGDIPMIIIAGNRTRHLFRLFQTIKNQKGVIRENFLLVTERTHEDTVRLAFILDVKVLFNRPKGVNATKISKTFRFAIFNALKLYPEGKAFIILEDDLILAPDFYSYMNQLYPLFDMDPTIYCVNAFNHLSYPHTSKDPTKLYRVKTVPAYGWMMPRRILEEIIPRWLPTEVHHDWDLMISADFMSNGRECIIPDINRSYHWATLGYHMKASYSAEKMFLSRTINMDPNIKFKPLNRLFKKNYEDEYVKLLKEAIPLDGKRVVTEEDFSSLISPGKVYSLFVSMNKTLDTASIRLAGEILEVWSRDYRDHHNFSWRLHYQNATIFVISVPVSPYKSFMPAGLELIKGNNSTNLENDFDEMFVRAKKSFLLHKNNFKLPFQ